MARGRQKAANGACASKVHVLDRRRSFRGLQKGRVQRAAWRHTFRPGHRHRSHPMYHQSKGHLWKHTGTVPRWTNPGVMQRGQHAHGRGNWIIRSICGKQLPAGRSASSIPGSP